MKMFAKIVAITFIASLMYGCGGSSGTAITGTISAPSSDGQFAFNQPTGFKRFFAQIFGSNAYAAVLGSSPVGAGVIVNLIEIDAAGIQVGPIIATGTTNADGTFAISAPASFIPAANYVIRAVGSTVDMDAIVTDTTVDIDPSTHATKELVVSATASVIDGLTNVTIEAIKEIQNYTDGLANDINTTGMSGYASAMAMKDEMDNDEAAINMLASIVNSGAIRGKVTNAAGVGLADIKIVARDYNNWVTQAMTRTNVNGDYTLHIPPSPTQGYIVGALNHTNDAAMSASEWYTAGGGVAAPLEAERVIVLTNTPTDLDFQLQNGTRISGTVTNSLTNALRGIIVQVRDVTTGFPVTGARTRADGTYTINVRSANANKYVIAAKNSTLQASASGAYNGSAAGGNNSTSGGALLIDGGTMITPIVGAALSINMELIPGSKIEGVVTDGAIVPAPVTGMAVRFYSENVNSTNGGFVEALRTNMLGKYRMWVQPGTYTVRSYGQFYTSTALIAGAVYTPAFNVAVGSTTMTVTSNGTTPVSQVKVQVYDSSTTPATFLSFEPTSGDGSVIVYSSVPATAKIGFLVDGGQAGVGSAMYNAASPTGLNMASATVVNMTTPTSLGTITLPVGFTLSGNITDGTGGTRVLQIRNGGTVEATHAFMSSRSQGDSSYSINLRGSVSASADYRVRVCTPGGGGCTGFATYTMEPTNTAKTWP